MDARIRVDGLREFQSALRALDGDFPKGLRQANKDAADIVAQEAKTRVPVMSGRLRSSIRALASQRSASVGVGGARLPYAAVQEFGWPGHNISPQPYIYPSISAKRAEVVEAYGDMIDALARRAFPS